MGIGVGVLLIAVGAILTFAVHATFNDFSISTVGVILMIAGVAGLLIDLAIFAPRRRSVTTTSQTYAASSQPAVGRTIVHDETSI